MVVGVASKILQTTFCAIKCCQPVAPPTRNIYHTFSTNLKYSEDERELMFIRDRESMGEREAFHKMHEKYEERLNKTKFFRSYRPEKK